MTSLNDPEVYPAASEPGFLQTSRMIEPALQGRPAPAGSPRTRVVTALVLLTLAAAIFCLHRGGYFLIEQSLPEGMEMSFAAAGGDQGYTIDLATYASAIRDAMEHPSLFRGDPYEIEHRGEHLPEGAVTLLLAGVPLLFSPAMSTAFWWGPLHSVGRFGHPSVVVHGDCAPG